VATVVLLALAALVAAGSARITGSELPTDISSARGRDELLSAEISQESSQAEASAERGHRRVFRDRVTPHWFAGNSRFWYRNDLRDGAKEFVLVDAEKGTRALAFDHAKLAAALSKAAGEEYQTDRLPFSSIAFVDEGQGVVFKVGDTVWRCDLSSYECAKTDRSIEFPAADGSEDDAGPPRRHGQRQRDDEGPPADRDRSPDGKWTAFIKDHNVFLKSRDDESKEVQLSTDGKEGLAYGRFSWSPDSTTLVSWRIEPGERKEVFLVQSSPQGGGRAKMTSRPYALPGDKFATYELNVFDVATRKQTKPEVDRFEHEWLPPRVRWMKEGQRFAYQQTDRGHQRLRVIEVDARSGAVRNLIDERSKTFIWTAHTENLGLSLVNWLERTEEIIYVSESKGWRHLYLIDASAVRENAATGEGAPAALAPDAAIGGRLKNPITQGEWVVRGIETIDETNRQVWFRASGVFPDQDPYLIHYGRVGFDGRGLTWLTAGTGNHSIQFSPDRRFVIDTYSRVDAAPVSELRRVSDGALVCRLEEADIAALKESGWGAPEVFVAQGRDGKTDIWGIICRPRDFDAAQKYPVIEDIYAGPQGSFVPKTFSAQRRYASLTDLGFIVVKIDGMGTANRSKAFHDVCWHNLKDGGFADRILWMKAAAAKYPAMDLTRVGVYGNSAGGQNAAAAVLFHPEFYKVAVASCGCHDNRMDKASWNEQWMGYVPPDKLWSKDWDNWYSACSNIDNAHRLRGKLFLIVGEMDNNVPPESTMRFVDGLIKAGKDFELLVVPNGGHGMGGSYGQRRMQDFFVRHLLGKEPPDRNGETRSEASERPGG
jgi:dipeptidyl aminopeptidase/acylaminoacyl peptidase